MRPRAENQNNRKCNNELNEIGVTKLDVKKINIPMLQRLLVLQSQC